MKDLNHVGTFNADWKALFLTLIVTIAIGAKSMTASDPNCRMNIFQITSINAIFPAPVLPITKVHLGNFVNIEIILFIF